MVRPLPLGLLIALALSTGCASMSSTMLTRDEHNFGWSRKGGLKGVPVTLKVPTHLRLSVVESQFLYTEGDAVKRLSLNYPVRRVDHEFIMGEKIFTVDFKRPAGGSFFLKLGFNGQRISDAEHNLTDQTIEQVSNALTALLPVTGAKPPGGTSDTKTPGSTGESDFVEVPSVVAVDLFEIDSPEFEHEMEVFINRHLNQAHDAWVASPPLDAAHRVGLTGTTQESNIGTGLLSPFAQRRDASRPTRNAVDGPAPRNRASGSR